ncbi:hypothetical protein NDU88_001352 [Pleurodeles waltl]|uniref:Uncharacterized protein n=1 Tax=Pleurodeles waltl TaxID=8319 RepID=A0AAV7LAQ7_PLEWA|nr:hypothetical protein NDU88_001352 [Pleurodeles waltl]
MGPRTLNFLLGLQRAELLARDGGGGSGTRQTSEERQEHAQGSGGPAACKGPRWGCGERPCCGGGERGCSGRKEARDAKLRLVRPGGVGCEDFAETLEVRSAWAR